jgi:hypothetical protein
MGIFMSDGRDANGVSPQGRTHKGDSNGLDAALLYSPDVTADHSSHRLPPMRCSFSGGCPSKLAWPKVERIMAGKPRPEDWYCYVHRKEAEKS